MWGTLPGSKSQDAGILLPTFAKGRQIWATLRFPLLVVGGDGGVGLPDGDLLDADPAFGGLLETAVALVEEILGEVFRRGVEDGEGLDVIDHLVVEIFDDGTHELLEVLEVEQEAGMVEFCALQDDADAIVVAMRILALALVVAQVVAGGKGFLHGYFKHES